MNSGRKSSIITAYSTLATVAVGLIGIDSYVRTHLLRDFPAQAQVAEVRQADQRSPAFTASEEQRKTAFASIRPVTTL